LTSDKTTLKDLSIFSPEGGVFALIDLTTTHAGRDHLRRHIQHPPSDYATLKELQDAVSFLSTHPAIWPSVISNGTLVMLEKYYEGADPIGSYPGGINRVFGSFLQKLLNRSEYFFTQFSLSHLSDFLKGCLHLADKADMPGMPQRLVKELSEMKEELDNNRLVPEIIKSDKSTPYNDIARLSYQARRELKNPVQRLTQIYARLDAWQSMAKATVTNKWSFPALLPPFPLHFEAKGLSHPLLKHPVAYDVSFDATKHFLLLTGANMSGKTTFMRSLGVTALLAHIGMGVPADRFEISFLEGIITNMQVEDNIILGESFFFAEVQRIKHTAEKLLQPNPHLVLMDELFKGTNVHDAFECTKAVVDGLLNHKEHIMVLSTHLYEVAQQFHEKPEIQFAYFVTEMSPSGNYHFNYQLKPGISNDRIGYRILKNEGVLDLLQKKREND
jgi:DNA mismatch repair protein MutS